MSEPAPLAPITISETTPSSFTDYSEYTFAVSHEPFDYAAPEGLSLIHILVKKGVLTLNMLIDLMHTNPSKRFGIGTPLAVGMPANLTVYDLNETYTIDPAEFCSCLLYPSRCV